MNDLLALHVEIAKARRSLNAPKNKTQAKRRLGLYERLQESGNGPVARIGMAEAERLRGFISTGKYGRGMTPGRADEERHRADSEYRRQTRLGLTGAKREQAAENRRVGIGHNGGPRLEEGPPTPSKGQYSAKRALRNGRAVYQPVYTPVSGEGQKAWVQEELPTREAAVQRARELENAKQQTAERGRSGSPLRSGFSGPLDHGTLNIPLSRRYGKGGIDGAIDRYKAQQEKDNRANDRAQAARLRSRRQEAKSLAGQIPADRMAELSSKFGLPADQVRSILTDAAVRGDKGMEALRRELRKPRSP